MFMLTCATVYYVLCSIVEMHVVCMYPPVAQVDVSMYTYRIRAHPQYIVHTVAHANIHKQVVYSTNTITILLHTLEKGWEVFVPPEQTMVTTDKHILNKWVQVYDLADRKD